MPSSALVERLALAALIGALPPAMVECALQRSGCAPERVRTLPPWVTAYHVLASALLPAATYDDITAMLWSVLPAATGRAVARQLPTTGAVTRARTRVGADALEVLLAEMVGRLGPAAQNPRLYLQRVQPAPGMSLWWTCDAATGGLRGCDLCGDDIAAAVDLVGQAARRGLRELVVCPPYGDWTRELVERIGPATAVAVGALPRDFAGPWAPLRGRTPTTRRQEVLAQACVRVAAELALTAPA